MSICGKIYKSYERNEEKFTLVHASKCQEPNAMIASVEPAKACARVQESFECGYSLVCQALANAALIVRYYDHDRVHQMVHRSAARRHARVTVILIAALIWLRQ